MSDQKYRQRGYKDEARPQRSEVLRQRAPREEPIGPRLPQFPARVTVARCANCGTLLARDIDPNGACQRCGLELHSCKQCVHFDTAARWECTQTISARVSSKDARNDCGFYSMRISSERETTSIVAPAAAGRPDDHRRAFENLFKK